MRTVLKDRSTFPRPCGRYGRMWIRLMLSLAHTSFWWCERYMAQLLTYRRVGDPREKNGRRIPFVLRVVGSPLLVIARARRSQQVLSTTARNETRPPRIDLGVEFVAVQSGTCTS